MHYRSRVDHGYEFTAEKDARLAGPLSADELNEEYYVHFKKHCTDRKRSYGGFPSLGAKPPTYDGISAESVVEVSQPKPKRIEVVCIGGQFPDKQFKFVLFKKSSGWLIDNAYTRRCLSKWFGAVALG